jgi:D-beta-D-heptose 7-phosphate kinase/D-beta-D-heptose 1-phosphate adenosyltransferase
MGRPRVLVVGDLILDRYTWGDAERVSQEAPVVVLRADERETRLGGAASVSHLLFGLRAEVSCAGVVGADAEGRRVRRMLLETGIDDRYLLYDHERPTTVKERFIGRAQGKHPHQILRVDSEVRRPLGTAVERRLVSQLIGALPNYQIVLISDYAKGVCTPSLLSSVIDQARTLGLLVVVDPIRSENYSMYKGASAMTPNRLEAKIATGVRIDRPEDAFEAGRQLCGSLGLEYCVVTLDKDGMALADAAGREEYFPTRPRQVYDITGAGDMVLAMLGAALASGVPISEAIGLANVAGGLEVEKVGVQVVTRDEIRRELSDTRPPAGGPGGKPAREKVLGREAASRLVAQARTEGRRVVFTNGCFDLLHVGHVSYLEQARTLGDVLVVAINADPGVRKLKGAGRPVVKETDRALMLASLACVDCVLVFEEDTPHALLHLLRPDVLVKGGTTPEVVGREVVEAYGGRVMTVDAVEGVSTTRLLSSLRGPHVIPLVQPAARAS